MTGLLQTAACSKHRKKKDGFSSDSKGVSHKAALLRKTACANLSLLLEVENLVFLAAHRNN